MTATKTDHRSTVARDDLPRRRGRVLRGHVHAADVRGVLARRSLLSFVGPLRRELRVRLRLVHDLPRRSHLLRVRRRGPLQADVLDGRRSVRVPFAVKA
jgi:hypothetical protein